MPLAEGAPVRLNRYLALAGMGTRRTVEGLVASGRIAVDGAVVTDPAHRVRPGQAVTLDGHPLRTRGPCGVLVALVAGELPVLAHPAELHLAGTNPGKGRAVLVDEPWLAARLRASGYDPGRLESARLGPGAFRPLSPAELEAARVFARRPR